MDVFGAVMLALVVVALYSFWGSHILAGGEAASAVAVEQKI